MSTFSVSFRSETGQKTGMRSSVCPILCILNYTSYSERPNIFVLIYAYLSLRPNQQVHIRTYILGRTRKREAWLKYDCTSDLLVRRISLRNCLVFFDQRFPEKS